MAFAGVHVTCGYAGSSSRNSSNQPVLAKAVWSETMASPATTALGAPGARDVQGDPMMRVRAAADSYAAVGAAPDATTGARHFVPAGEFVEFYVETGDKLAWVLA